MLHRLQLHPGGQQPALRKLEADIASLGAGRLELRFCLTGELDKLNLPPPAGPIRTDELWRHTCFEAFLRGRSSDAYCELNLSPSRAWAAYRFDGYRTGMRNAEGVSPVAIESASTENGFQLHAVFDIAEPDILASPQDWRVGLSAVIEADDGAISYWALAHPPGQADFHHPACFALNLGGEPSRATEIIQE